MKYSLQWLQNQVENKPGLDYLFFWGHTQKQAGIIDKSCFSQWFPSPFYVDDVCYKTAEHWMMVKKALLFNDNNSAAQIIVADKPSSAKAIGRTVTNFNAALWNEQAFNIVVEGNKHKFSQNAALKDFLFGTGNQIIVEASPADAVWGIGLAQDAADAGNPLKWPGNNLLGFALMEVRDLLSK